MEMGESLGLGGEPVLIVDAVEGLSLPRLWSFLDWRKALKTSGGGPESTAVPKDAELSPAYVARVDGGGLCVNMDGFSEENPSKGYASCAYTGGPTGTPYLLW